jgi:hypothetical protein
MSQRSVQIWLATAEQRMNYRDKNIDTVVESVRVFSEND